MISGREVVILAERDGKRMYLHGVAIAPPGVNKENALRLIDQAFLAATQPEETGGEWDYGDVWDELKKRGFEDADCEVWYEDEV